MTMLSPPHMNALSMLLTVVVVGLVCRGSNGRMTTLSERGPEVTYANLTSRNFWVQQSSSKD